MKCNNLLKFCLPFGFFLCGTLFIGETILVQYVNNTILDDISTRNNISIHAGICAAQSFLIAYLFIWKSRKTPLVIMSNPLVNGYE